MPRRAGVSISLAALLLAVAATAASALAAPKAKPAAARSAGGHKMRAAARPVAGKVGPQAMPMVPAPPMRTGVHS